MNDEQFQETFLKVKWLGIGHSGRLGCRYSASIGFLLTLALVLFQSLVSNVLLISSVESELNVACLKSQILV